MKPKKTNPKKPKRPMGRPPLDQRVKRSIVLSLRVSPTEHEAWEAMAAAKGLSIRDYILKAHRETLKRKGIL